MPFTIMLFLNSSKHNIFTLCSSYDLGRKQPSEHPGAEKLAWCLCDRAEPRSATPDFLETPAAGFHHNEALNCEQVWESRAQPGDLEWLWFSRANGETTGVCRCNPWDTVPTAHFETEFSWNRSLCGPPPPPNTHVHTLVLHGAQKLHPENFCQPWLQVLGG